MIRPYRGAGALKLLQPAKKQKDNDGNQLQTRLLQVTSVVDVARLSALGAPSSRHAQPRWWQRPQ